MKKTLVHCRTTLWVKQERIFYFSCGKGQGSCLPWWGMEMQMSSRRKIWATGGIGGVVGGGPLLFPAPVSLVWVGLGWKWPQEASAGASISLRGIAEVRSSGKLDLREVGGGTVPPCGWRMKLNMKWEGTTLFGGRREKQSPNRKGRGRQSSNKKMESFRDNEGWKIKIQVLWTYDTIQEISAFKKKKICFTVKTC